MSAEYRQLLEAAISHLERLKAQGVRHVPVSLEALSALATTPGAPAAKGAAVRATHPSAKAPVADVPVPRRAPVLAPETGTFETAIAQPGLVAAPRSPVAPRVDKPLPPKLGPEALETALAALRQKVLACQQCAHLVAFRHNVVFGTGDPHARILFVGEAPGADEDLAGEPFVGAAGALLTKIIVAMGLSRETVYIANILKCRPDVPAGVPGNRKPRSEEMATCTPWLHEQIDLIQPQVMVALGSTAIEGLLGGPVFVNRVRGKWHSYRGIPLMPTFHPAYLLRNEVISEKRKVWEDMLAVMERLEMPISAKQRAYFTTR